MKSFNIQLFDEVKWNFPGLEIEKQSFDIIESEYQKKNNFDSQTWKLARRLIHTTADFSIADDLVLANNPIEAGLKALKSGTLLFSDSNMIKSGISVPKLKNFYSNYERESINCYIADRDVAESAKKNTTTRALSAVEKAKPILNAAIVLIGNAPLALAKIIKLYIEEGIKPALIIGMPVGFVNVLESKKLLMETDLPYVTISGRRGGSTLAVATLHAIMENI